MGGGGSPQDIFPIWIFFQASEAVNIQESMMPATVNVPPTMAQIYRRGEGGESLINHSDSLAI